MSLQLVTMALLLSFSSQSRHSGIGHVASPRQKKKRNSNNYHYIANTLFLVSFFPGTLLLLSLLGKIHIPFSEYVRDAH
jgi:hypothetical protein